MLNSFCLEFAILTPFVTCWSESLSDTSGITTLLTSVVLVESTSRKSMHFSIQTFLLHLNNKSHQQIGLRKAFLT